MNKFILAFASILFFISEVWSQDQSIINNVLKKSIETKISAMQQLIGFDENQAIRLKEVEYAFLLDVRKAENCFFCNKKKRIEKLKQKRNTQLQEILTREQYIKYDAVENNRIKKYPLWSKFLIKKSSLRNQVFIFS